jgi:hypothetical protein
MWISDKEDPDEKSVQTGSADRIGEVYHMGRFLVFPIPAVIFKFQNPSFFPAYSMIHFIGMLG